MISHWLLAARLKTLPVSICPILLAISLSLSLPSFNVYIAIITLITALFIQVGTNFANDYVDFKKGADNDTRIGPIRMTQSGKISPLSMKKATYLVFSGAIFCGGILVYYGGWPILIIGISSVFFGVIYTAGPFALAYIGGAEFISYLFFGPISVMGTYYLQTATWSFDLFFIGSAFGLITTGLLVVNNTRDIESDRKVNKKTFSVRFGRLFSYFEYIFCIYTPLFLLDIVTENSSHQMVLVLILVFIAMLLTRRFGKAKGIEFNRLLAQTSLYLILFTIISIYLFS